MIESDFICADCGEAQSVRHSIKEKPLPICPACQTPMERLVAGGSHSLIKGGKVDSKVAKVVTDKDRADMDHARTVAQNIKSFAQPKTQEAFLKRESIKGETQPAIPAKRTRKPH
ncbi:MAG: zinc ribbon domain-containing protein [Candidatus Sumerlaeia bacterium]|nr:zinc ribbon domain-containing protein [Candidatus Sumerlaeia bacterium]